MSKEHLLLVDSDLRNLRVWEMALEQAGFAVTSSDSGVAARKALDTLHPALIVIDLDLPDTNGFSLLSALRDDPKLAKVPVVLLAQDGSVDNRMRALELGVEDYFVKPAFVADVIARIETMLQQAQRRRLSAGLESDERARFSGQLSQMSLVDLLETLERSGHSGVLHLRGEDGEARGALYFQMGQVIDGALDGLEAEQAVYQALLLGNGRFDVELREIERPVRIVTSTRGVLLEGLRRRKEWQALLADLPPLDHILEVNESELLDRLAELPDDVNRVLREVHGARDLGTILSACDGDSLETLGTLRKLYFEGLLFDAGQPITREQQASELPAAIGGTVGAQRGPATHRGLNGAQGGDEVRKEPERAFGPTEEARREPPSIAPNGALTESTPTLKRTRKRRRRRGASSTLPPEPVSMSPRPPSRSETMRAPGATAQPPESVQPPDGRKRRRRRKRLSLATSPGMLSIPGEQVSVSETWAGSVVPMPPTRIATSSAPPRTAAASEAEKSGELSPPQGDGHEIRSAVKTAIPPPMLRDTAELPSPVPQGSAGTEPKDTEDAPAEALPLLGGRQLSSKPAGSQPRAATSQSERAHPAPPRPSRPRTARAVSPLQQELPELPLPRRNIRGPLLTISGLAVAVVIAFALGSRDDSREAPSPPVSLSTENTAAVARPSGAEPTESSTDEGLPPGPASAAAAAADGRGGSGPPEEEEKAVEARADVPQEEPTNSPSAIAEETEAAATDDPEVERLLAQAEQLRRKNKHRAATALYRQAATIAPTRSDVLGRLAFEELNAGDNRGARKHAEAAVAIDKSNAEGWIVLGAALQAMGDPRGARDAYQKCAEHGQGDYVNECKRMVH